MQFLRPSIQISLIATSVLGVSVVHIPLASCFIQPIHFRSYAACGYELFQRRHKFSNSMPRLTVQTRRQGLCMSVSTEELTPGSEQMKSRAQKAIQKMGKQLLTPLEAANLLAGNKNELTLSPQEANDQEEVIFIDVRTPQQRADHEILAGGVKVCS